MALFFLIHIQILSIVQKNTRTLRNQTQQHVLRIAYYFDTERKAFLLTGGDKKGKDQKKFYKDSEFNIGKLGRKLGIVV